MFDARHGSQLLQKMFQTVENIIHLIDKDDMSKYLLFLEDVFPYMEKYHYQKGMKEIIRELKQLLKGNESSSRRTWNEACRRRSSGACIPSRRSSGICDLLPRQGVLPEQSTPRKTRYQRHQTKDITRDFKKSLLFRPYGAII